MLGTYDELSSEYSVDFSGLLRQVAVFSLIVYEGVPPDRTEVFLCDLINADEPDSSVEVAPQSVTVRFLSSESTHYPIASKLCTAVVSTL